MIDYVVIDSTDDSTSNPPPISLQYTCSQPPGDYLYNTTELMINTPENVWTQFVSVSSMGIFDFISLQTDIYSYLGHLSAEQLPSSNTKYWLEVALCDESGTPLHTLVDDAVSPLIFTSKDIDGDPYSQSFDNNTYYKVWNFPNDIVEPNKVRKIRLRLGVDSNLKTVQPYEKSGEIWLIDENNLLGTTASDGLYPCEEEIIIDEDSGMEQFVYNKLGIYFENIKISFGYDLNKYINEGIILAVPNTPEVQAIQTGYTNAANNSPHKPAITAWIMREDQKGLLRSEDLQQTEETQNVLSLIQEMETLIPRYATYDVPNSYKDQRGFFIQGNANKGGVTLRDNWLEEGAIIKVEAADQVFWKLELLSGESKNSLRGLLNTAKTEYYPNLADEIETQISQKIISMEGYVSQLISDYYPYQENGEGNVEAIRLLTEAETKTIITAFYTEYEDLISLLLDIPKKDYQLRWYQYQFGATIDDGKSDNIGGNFWVPISNNVEELEGGVKNSNFEYYLGIDLLPEQYILTEDASTTIKAILCQEGYATETKDFTTGVLDEEGSDILYNKKVTTSAGTRVICEKTIAFTNGAFTRNEERATEYLKISGQTFLNIYNSNNTLNTSQQSKGWNQLTVEFIEKEEQAKQTMGLTDHSSLVVWEILNPDGPIEYFKLPANVNTGVADLRQWWAEHILSKAGEDIDKFRCSNWQYTTSAITVWLMRVCNTGEVGKHYPFPLQQLAEDGQRSIIQEELDTLLTLVTAVTATSATDSITEIETVLEELYEDMAYNESSAGRYGFAAIQSLFGRKMRIVYDVLTALESWEDNKDNLTSVELRYSETSDLWRTITYNARNSFDFSNNVSTIRCTIDKIYSVDIQITFSLIGTQGTDYVLTIEPVIINAAGDTVTIDENYIGLKNKSRPWSEISKQSFQAVLRSKDGQAVTIPAEKLKWSWSQGNEYKCCYGKTTAANISSVSTTYKSHVSRRDGEHFFRNTTSPSPSAQGDYIVRDYIHLLTPNEDEVALNCATIQLMGQLHHRYNNVKDYKYSTKSGSSNILTFMSCSTPNAYVLKAACKVTQLYNDFNSFTEAKEVEIYAYYPITVYDEEYFESFEGPVSFVWDEQNKLTFPGRRSNATADSDGFYPQEGVNGEDICKIKLKKSCQGLAKITTDDDKMWMAVRLVDHGTYTGDYPNARTNIEASYYIREIPSSGIAFGYCSEKIVFSSCISSSDTSINGHIIYQRPVFTSIGEYSLDASIEWSGQGIYSNTDKGTIMTTQIGAGEKDAQGRFTGVIMGTVSKNYSSNYEQGLFGYKQGQECFRLSSTGDFIVKKDDNNYISFANNSFKIRAKDDFYIGGSDYYISANSSGLELVASRLNFKVDDNNYIELDSNKFKLATQNIAINASSDSGLMQIYSDPTIVGDYIWISNSDHSPLFAVRENGSVSIAGGKLDYNPYNDTLSIEGHIVAKSGLIGKCSLDDGKLTLNNVALEVGSGKQGLEFLDYGDPIGKIEYTRTILGTDSKYAHGGAIVGFTMNGWFTQPIFAKHGIDLTPPGTNNSSFAFPAAGEITGCTKATIGTAYIDIARINQLSWNNSLYTLERKATGNSGEYYLVIQA